jgi:hypothetical protein
MPTGARTLVRRAFLCAVLVSVVSPAAAQADLVFDPDATPVSFGDTTVMNSSERTVTVRNASASNSVNIFNTSIGPGPSANQFGVGPGLCPPTLAPLASCNITVRFNPSQTGNVAATLQIAHNGGPAPVLTRQLTGTGVPANLLRSPNSLDFGIVRIHDGGESRSIQVQNVGTAATQVNRIDIDGPDASAFRLENSSCMGQTISPGQNCPVSVRFEPQEDRAHNATLHIRAGGSDFPVTLTGAGGMSELTLTPDPLDFGNVAVGSSATATVTARSMGNAPFDAIVVILSGGDLGDIRIVKDMCGLRILIPTQQCAITMRFTPSAVGPAEAGLAVIGNDHPVIAMVRGNGVPAAGAPTPPSPRKAGVVFKRKSATARIDRGRVKLGRVRCKGAPSCTATVRTRFTVRPPGARRQYLVRGRSQKWTLPRKRPVSIRVPDGIRGTLSGVIVTVRTTAPGYTASRQRKVLLLMTAKGSRRSR